MSEVLIINEKENTKDPVTAPSAAPSAEEQVVNNSAAADGAPEEVAAGDANVSATEESSPQIVNKKTPTKRTPSKRMSFIERAQKESEELVKNMGGSLELEGGRRTRSSTRGTPTRAVVVSTPPPAKKARSSPANSNSQSRARGRGRKIDTSTEHEEVVGTPELPEESGETAKANETNEAEKPSEETAATIESNAATTRPEVKEISSTETSSDKGEDKQKEESSLADKSEDKPDASSVSVPEKEQNNIDHSVEETKAEDKLKPDSPMDTDEHDEIVAVTATVVEKPQNVLAAAGVVNEIIKEPVTSKLALTENQSSIIVAEVVEPVVEKLPTPEPMEVDSSPISINDGAVETENLVASPSPLTEKVDEVNAETVQTNSISLTADKEAQHTESAAVEKDVTDSTPVKAPEEKLVIEATPPPPVIENNASEIIVEKTSIKNDIKSTPAEIVNSVDISDSPEPIATCAAAKEAASPANQNKSENDFCEPKIAASQLSEAESAPQFCN